MIHERISFDPMVARKIGLAEAVFLEKLRSCSNYGGLAFGDDYWIRLTLAEWGEELPFFTRRTIRTVIANLHRLDLINIGNQNKELDLLNIGNQNKKKKKNTRTLSYRFNYDVFSEMLHSDE